MRWRAVVRWRTGVPLETGTVDAGVLVLTVVVIPTVRHHRGHQVAGGRGVAGGRT